MLCLCDFIGTKINEALIGSLRSNLDASLVGFVVNCCKGGHIPIKTTFVIISRVGRSISLKNVKSQIFEGLQYRKTCIGIIKNCSLFD